MLQRRNKEIPHRIPLSGTMLGMSTEAVAMFLRFRNRCSHQILMRGDVPEVDPLAPEEAMKRVAAIPDRPDAPQNGSSAGVVLASKSLNFDFGYVRQSTNYFVVSPFIASDQLVFQNRSSVSSSVAVVRRLIKRRGGNLLRACHSRR